MIDSDIVLPMIVATALLTFGIRYLPVTLLRGRNLNPVLRRFLRCLPIGILSALVAQSAFLRGGALTTGVSDYYLHGIVVVLVLTIWTRSLASAVFGGLAVVGLLTFLAHGS